MKHGMRLASKRTLKGCLTTAYAVGTMDKNGIMRLYRPRHIKPETNKLVCLRGRKIFHLDMDKVVRVVT